MAGRQRRAARRLGAKVKDQDELEVLLRQLVGYSDDGSKTFTIIPEGVDREVLEQRFDVLISEAAVGRQEAENKQFIKDAKRFERSR